MSANENVSRLQGLLERVQMRGVLPREARLGAHAASPVYAAPAPAPVLLEAAQHAFEDPAVELEVAEATPAPAPVSSLPPATVEYEADGDMDSDMEVEVSSEVVEVDIDIDEPMPMESGAQLVAQQTMPPGELEAEEELEPLVAQAAEEPAAELEEVVEEAAPLANEVEEPSPSSSRRPIAGEEPLAEAYGEESAPRHTPPPESGKQVAVAPSAPPARDPSVPPPSMPPPSLEGHTLVGGWREPGLGPQVGPALITGSPVRVPAPGMPSPLGEPAAAAAQPSGARLSADVTRPNLPPRANVASFQGAVAVAKPKTLGELLDLTLGL